MNQKFLITLIIIRDVFGFYLSMFIKGIIILKESEKMSLKIPLNINYVSHIFNAPENKLV